MKKRWLFATVLAAVVVLIAAGAVFFAAARAANKAVEALLPSAEGFQWRYTGFADYSHSMRLDRIDRGILGASYRISGQVEDLSGGDSGADYSIEITYAVRSGSLVQTKRGPMLMDSDFDALVLISAPLEKGRRWSQRVSGSTGEESVLDCSITGVEDEGGKKVYTVLYKERGGDYYELRRIKEGLGVVYFEKLFQSGSDSFAISCRLEEEP